MGLSLDIYVPVDLNSESYFPAIFKSDGLSSEHMYMRRSIHNKHINEEPIYIKDDYEDPYGSPICAYRNDLICTHLRIMHNPYSRHISEFLNKAFKPDHPVILYWH